MPTHPGFTVIEGWEKCPSGYTHKDICGVSVDSRNRVYVLTRMQARVMVYEADGTFVESWGEGSFTERTHGLTIGPDDCLYAVDDGNHTVRKFTPDGKEVLCIGTGVPSDTGYDGKTIASIRRGGPPFNRPTNVAVAPNGDLYVCDGYGNARVHRFSADGKLIRSWGEPGTGPGQFHLPHSLRVTPDNRLLVADRENDRIQIFDLEGSYLDEWTHVQRPTDISLDRDGLVYVSELWWRVGQASFRCGKIRHDLPGRVTVLDLQGNVLLSWTSADREAWGNFIAPHCLCVDRRGDLYVGEVTETFGVARGVATAGSHTLQKFARNEQR
jgi:DNA-binding beta-propeller fold protein YncE